MNELTFIYKDTAFTNSLIISKGANVDHRSAYLLIEKYKVELEEFGRVSFEMIPLETNGGIQKIKVYRLNEEQATFLISLMKSTKPVIDFKKELVKQFYQMKSFINTLITARKEFPLLTENIKLIHEKVSLSSWVEECKHDLRRSAYGSFILWGSNHKRVSRQGAAGSVFAWGGGCGANIGGSLEFAGRRRG